MNSPVLFRTYESPHEASQDFTIWQAVRATSATPGIFKRIEIGQNQPYIDGGMGHNNPTQLVLDEANSLFAARPIGCVVSIGTGCADIIRIKRFGFWHRIVPTNIMGMLGAIATDCEHTHEELLRCFSNTPGTYFRLNVDQGLQSGQLAEWERLDIIEAHTIQYMRKQETQETTERLVSVMKVPTTQLTVEQLVAPRAAQSLAQNLGRKPCPSPVLSFKGRKDILNQINAFFQSDDISEHVFVLDGLGGSGKSQIVFKFAKESNIFSKIFYVDATNESIFKADLKIIAPESSKLSAEQIPRWLENQTTKWLLVIDNADETELNLQPYLPTHGNIIITTRNIQLRSYATGTGYLSVGNMHEDEAAELLLHLARIKADQKNIELAGKVVQDLHWHALAISQAGSYIFINQYSLQKYYKLYQQEHDKMLQYSSVQGQDKAVYATWKLSYDKLDESSQLFLHVCSLLHHEGISEEIFERAALSDEHIDDSMVQDKVTQLLGYFKGKDSHWSLAAFQEIISKLSSYSLIQLDYEHEEKSVYKIHPLVQYWGRTVVEKEIKTMRKFVLTILGLSLPHKISENEHKYQRRAWPHILMVNSGINLVEMNIQILEKVGFVCGQQGHWKDEEIFIKAAVEKSQTTFGDDSAHTLKYMMNLGNAYHNQGQWKDAEALQIVISEKMKDILGEDHPDTLTIMSHLANTYSWQDRWKDAETIQKVVLHKRQETLGETHLDTLNVMSNLANVYSQQGRWKDAESLQLVVFQTRKDVLGGNHPDTLATMLNLASSYRQQGHWKEAKSLQSVALQKMKETFGEDHPYTLGIMSNLATTSYQLGLWEDAKLLQLVVMQKMKERLGENHPHTLGIMANLANIYCQLGDLKDAESLQVLIFGKRKELLGEDHSDTLAIMTNLATTYYEQGNWKAAESLQLVVLEKRKEKLGETDLHTLNIMSNLANTYQKQNLFKEAESLQLMVLQKRKEKLQENHPDTLTVKSELAITYQKQGLWKDAESLQMIVLEKRKELLGEEHPETVKIMKDLAVTYKELGYTSDAEKLENMMLKKDIPEK